MKAVVFHGRRDVRVDTVPDPTIEAPSDAVIRVTSSGICGSDLHLYEVLSPFMEVGDILGHEPIGVVEAGGRTVSLGSILGPEFAATPKVMFGPDRFHPSAAGYSSMAAALLPSVLAAVGLIPDEELLPEAARGETVLPVSEAAVEAAKVPGTEIDGTEVAGSTRGAFGRWAQIRRRRRTNLQDHRATLEEALAVAVEIALGSLAGGFFSGGVPAPSGALLVGSCGSAMRPLLELPLS